MPLNRKTYIHSKNHKTITRIDRKSIFDGGVYFTPGHFESFWDVPKQYVKPNYSRAGLQTGSFEFIAQWKDDTCTIYSLSTNSDTNNLSALFSYKYANGYKEWLKMKNDKSGKFIYINHCRWAYFLHAYTKTGFRLYKRYYSYAWEKGIIAWIAEILSWHTKLIDNQGFALWKHTIFFDHLTI